MLCRTFGLATAMLLTASPALAQGVGEENPAEMNSGAFGQFVSGTATVEGQQFGSQVSDWASSEPGTAKAVVQDTKEATMGTPPGKRDE